MIVSLPSKKSLHFTMTELQNQRKIYAWARPSFRSTPVANPKCRSQFTMCWNDCQSLSMCVQGLRALCVYTHCSEAWIPLYTTSCTSPVGIPERNKESSCDGCVVPLPEAEKQSAMIGIQNITMRAECMRWATGSKSPKRITKGWMCGPKDQRDVAMSTEQWCACREYKLCCAAYLLYHTRLRFLLYSTKMTALEFDGCVPFRKLLCYLRMIGTTDVSNACMREIASFSTSPNTHVLLYAGEKMTSLISMSTELVRAEHTYKVRYWRVLSTTPILTSFLCLPKHGGYWLWLC